VKKTEAHAQESQIGGRDMNMYQLEKEGGIEHDCWICGKPGLGLIWFYVDHETPGGKICPTKRVRVHFACLLDLGP